MDRSPTSAVDSAIIRQPHRDTDYRGFQVFDQALQAEGGPGAVDLRDLLRDDKLIDGGHFRYAATATATLEYMNLGYYGANDAARNLVSVAKQNVNAVSDGHGGTTLSYDLALGADGNPVLAWNPAAFDAQGKALIPMLSFPANDNCMQCQRTSNSRRGFYGFGEGAEAVYDQDGIVEEHYQDDVHYGKVFTEANGEARGIRTCNACHARNYAPDFLLGGPYSDTLTDFCFRCHDAEPYRRPNIHRQLDARGKPERALCEYCHREENPLDAKPLRHFSHPHRDLVLRSDPDDLPLLDETDRLTEFGRIGCISCHDPHQWRPGGGPQSVRLVAEGENEEGNVLSSFLRRNGAGGSFCASCHGLEARMKYQYSHDERGREKGVGYLR